MGKDSAVLEVMPDFGKLQDSFRSHWISLKFYESKPEGFKVRRNTHFCEAIGLALTEPVLIKLSDIPCAGGKYVFQNDLKAKSKLAADFCGKKGFSKQSVENILQKICRLPKNYAYAGFNTDECKPDFAISFMSPEEMTSFITVYNAKTGKKLSCELTGFMSVCGECAAKSMAHNTVTVSFGSEDARKYSELSERAVVCVPFKMIKLFIRGEKSHSH